MTTQKEKDKKAIKHLDKRNADVLRKVKYKTVNVKGNILERDLIGRIAELTLRGEAIYVSNMGGFPGPTFHHIYHFDNSTIVVGYDDVYIVGKQSDIEKTRKNLENKLKVKLKEALHG